MVPRPDATVAPLEDLPPIEPDDLAYLLFTSGSTGEPKGVPITHRNITSFLVTCQDRYRLGPDDRLSHGFEPGFDLSVFDLFMAWQVGARTCVLSPLELLTAPRAVERLGLTVWFSVPSLIGLLRRKSLLAPDAMPTLRWSLFCGEPLSLGSARAWKDAAPGSVVENLYGPTELTLACSAQRFDPQETPASCVNGIVPIGELFPGLRGLVVDGELCVAGPQTFPGYWRRDDLTAAACFEREGERYYRTGDRVRRLGDGRLAHLGRIDQQLKVNGHRVEAGEIEAALLARPGVLEAVVVPEPAEDGVVSALRAWLVLAPGSTAPTREELRDRLPDALLPGRIEVVDVLPRNASGKIDRRALVGCRVGSLH